MKRINFKKLKVEIKIGVYENMDVAEQIGNTLHQESVTVPMSDLARKIYYSESYVKISDDLFEGMINILNGRYKQFVIDALMEASKEPDVQEQK